MSGQYLFMRSVISGGLYQSRVNCKLLAPYLPLLGCEGCASCGGGARSQYGGGVSAGKWAKVVLTGPQQVDVRLTRVSGPWVMNVLQPHMFLAHQVANTWVSLRGS